MLIVLSGFGFGSSALAWSQAVQVSPATNRILVVERRLPRRGIGVSARDRLNRCHILMGVPVVLSLEAIPLPNHSQEVSATVVLKERLCWFSLKWKEGALRY